MQDHFVEISPGYLIPIRLIEAVQWKDGKLLIAYEKGGSSTTVEVKDVRGSAQYLYDQLREITITFETGPDFVAEE